MYDGLAYGISVEVEVFRDFDDAVTIPSENLKTDKNFSFDVQGGGAADITIDFDLSQSIVVTDDGSGTLSYKLKPVLHIVDTVEAATITGRIANYRVEIDFDLDNSFDWDENVRADDLSAGVTFS
jgi:hypothetical protein